MEHLERLDPLLIWIAELRADLIFFTQKALALELPVPDVAMAVALVLAIIATLLAQRGRPQSSDSELEALYQAELLTANRRAQQAHGQLRKAKLEIERERQKRRRDAQKQVRRAEALLPPPRRAS